MDEIKSITFKATEKEVEMMNEMKEYLEQTYGGPVSKTDAWVGLIHFGYSWMNTAKNEAAASAEKETITAELPVEAPQDTYLTNRPRQPFDLDYYKGMANK